LSRNKTNLADELIMTTYIGLRDDKIVSLTVIHKKPSRY